MYRCMLYILLALGRFAGGLRPVQVPIIQITSNNTHRPHEDMVGVNMALAEYHQNTQIANSKYSYNNHVRI